jgi:hypothetical protein
MKRRIIVIMSWIVIVMTLLLIPFLFKKKNHEKLLGPELSEVKYSEISYDNKPANLKLSGMLILPEGKGPFPTAILIHGSGPSRRNNVWYLSVARHLQKNGIAVLLPDKRGCEKSEGNWIGANFDDLSTDVLSSVEFVKNQRIYNSLNVGIIGMSQGGWIAPVAATKSKDISFIVSMSGAVVTTDEQLLYEEINNIAPYTYSFIARLIAPVTSNNLKKKDFFAPIAGFDPIPYLKKIRVPIFYAFGGNDKNVPVEASILRLKENKFNNFKIKVYPDGGHAIADRTNYVSKLFLNDLTSFINQVSTEQFNK